VSQARSLASRAVEVGLRGASRPGPQPGPESGPHIVVLGSGRMAAAAVERLHLFGHRPVVVARSPWHAARLVGADRVRDLPDLRDEVRRADLLVSATSADHALVTTDLVGRARTGAPHPMTVVDLSVPRNVEPAVGALPGLTLVDIEDLNADPAAEPALGEALLHAEALVAEAARRYTEHVAARRAGPLIAAMRRRVEQVCVETLTGAQPSADPEQIAVSVHRLAGRLAHPATMAARAAAAAGDEATLLALGEAFGVPWPQSLTTTYDAAVELINGLPSQPGGVMGRSSGAETCTTTRSSVASTTKRSPG
jgi:glutamyl-tRNA reductase